MNTSARDEHFSCFRSFRFRILQRGRERKREREEIQSLDENLAIIWFTSAKLRVTHSHNKSNIKGQPFAIMFIPQIQSQATQRNVHVKERRVVGMVPDHDCNLNGERIESEIVWRYAQIWRQKFPWALRLYFTKDFSWSVWIVLYYGILERSVP